MHLRVNITLHICCLLRIACSPTEEHLASLIYERMPKLCFQCGHIGHLKPDCTWPSIQEHDPYQLTYGLWLQTDVHSSKIIRSSESKQPYQYWDIVHNFQWMLKKIWRRMRIWSIVYSLFIGSSRAISLPHNLCCQTSFQPQLEFLYSSTQTDVGWLIYKITWLNKNICSNPK